MVFKMAKKFLRSGLFFLTICGETTILDRLFWIVYWNWPNLIDCVNRLLETTMSEYLCDSTKGESTFMKWHRASIWLEKLGKRWLITTVPGFWQDNHGKPRWEWCKDFRYVNLTQNLLFYSKFIPYSWRRFYNFFKFWFKN